MLTSSSFKYRHTHTVYSLLALLIGSLCLVGQTNAPLVATSQASANASTFTFTPGTNLDIAGIVNNSPQGTTFIFQPGVYRLLQLVPKDNDVFIGQPGAILNGSTVATGFVRVGNLWKLSNQTQRGFTSGACDSLHPMCAKPEDVFINNVPLNAVASLSNVVPGTFYFDYANRAIYIADDPTNHVVETNVARSAFSGPGQNVTIQGFVVEKYAIPGQFGAIGDQYPGNGWIIKQNEVRLNHGAGITLSSNATASDNYVHHNGQVGIATADTTGHTASGLLIANNELAFNNYAGFDTGWEAGGAKLCSAVGLIARNNNVHDNNGPGLWTDIESSNVLYEGNFIRNNAGVGILHEISYTAIIRQNVVSGNYRPDGAWFWGAQIMVQNSRNVEVYANVIEAPLDKGHGIIIVQQNRGLNGSGVEFNSVNNYIHNNTLIYDGSGGSSGLAGDYNLPYVLGAAGNNRFDFNSYQVTDVNAIHWVWDQAKSFSSFQTLKQESSGLIDTRLTPIVKGWSSFVQ